MSPRLTMVKIYSKMAAMSREGQLYFYFQIFIRQESVFI